MTPWVTIEGVNGVGKSHLGRLAAQQLGAQCVALVELPDLPPGGLPGRVIGALHGAGDLFLRTGSPRTETLLLAALQVHRWEGLGAVGPGQVVLEDRGPHSVAIYQAAVLAEDRAADDAWALEQALAIAATIGAWRPPPTATILLLDDARQCLERFEARIRRRCASDELALIARVGRLYRLFIAAQPGRWTVLDRREVGEDAAVEFIADVCRRAAAVRPGRTTPCSVR